MNPVTRPGPKQVRPSHNEMINWLIANPHRPYLDGAEYFGVTQAWFSIVVNSDAFQVRLRQRQDEHFHNLSNGVVNRLKGVTELALEKLADKVEETEDKDYILDASSRLLDALGYSSKNRNPAPQAPAAPPGAVYVDVKVLAEARERLIQPGSNGVTHAIDVESKSGVAVRAEGKEGVKG